MEIWLALPFLAASSATEVIEPLRGSGLAGIAVSDHLCAPLDIRSAYPYTGRAAVLPHDTELPDPIVLAALITASAPDLRVMTNVLVGPLYHPIALARSVATVAAASGGRLDLGLGAGWLREEFTALGIDFQRRGARLDELIPLLRRLWSGDPVSSPGPHYEFPEVCVHPTPPAPVPILVGGQSRAALRRAAQLGDGWVGLGLTPDQLKASRHTLDQFRDAARRQDAIFCTRASLAGRLTPEAMRVAAGLVDGLVIELWQLAPRRTPVVDVPTEDLLGRLHELTTALQEGIDA
jgi:probable F420-dependent oxidoreductase